MRPRMNGSRPTTSFGPFWSVICRRRPARRPFSTSAAETACVLAFWRPRLLAAQPRLTAQSLTADLHVAGYGAQTSVDFSRVVVAAMAAKHAALGSTWRVMDVRALQLPSASFAVAIDKGTLDAMLHGSLWDPPDDVRASVRAYVDEVGRLCVRVVLTAKVARVLKPGGCWLYITYRQPHFLRPLLQREVWDLQVDMLDEGGGAFEYFGFVMRKSRSHCRGET
jgi:hypothetical protein